MVETPEDVVMAPEDVVQAAVATFDRLPLWFTQTVNSAAKHKAIGEIARAIMVERQRCAKIADRFRSSLDRDFSRGQHSAAHNIALAIRNGVTVEQFGPGLFGER